MPEDGEMVQITFNDDYLDRALVLYGQTSHIDYANRPALNEALDTIPILIKVIRELGGPEQLAELRRLDKSKDHEATVDEDPCGFCCRFDQNGVCIVCKRVAGKGQS